jgi:O-acetylhomoserine/O-acetylserine sulfhydrylase-like pyridoxal-dependent enzyme
LAADPSHSVRKAAKPWSQNFRWPVLVACARGGSRRKVLEACQPAGFFLERCSLFALAEGLGGVESLIEHPALMTHGSVPSDVRVQLGIGDTLVRLSVGIEDADDLMADIEQALAAI